MKKVAILYSEYTPTIDAIRYQIKDADVECFDKVPQNINEFELTLLVNFKGEYSGKALCCHHSLLPAFNTETPIKDAVISGVKVTGITIFETDTKNIIAQYPVFISNDTHYDNLKQEILYLEQTIYPIVAEKILLNQIFDLNKIVNKKCSGSCGGCNECRH